MKLNCGPDAQERQDIRDSKALARKTKRRQWHTWFAWYPVRVGKRDCRWLEFVHRRREMGTKFYWGQFDCRPRRYEAEIGWEYQSCP